MHVFCCCFSSVVLVSCLFFWCHERGTIASLLQIYVLKSRVKLLHCFRSSNYMQFIGVPLKRSTALRNSFKKSITNLEFSSILPFSLSPFPFRIYYSLRLWSDWFLSRVRQPGVPQLRQAATDPSLQICPRAFLGYCVNLAFRQHIKRCIFTYHYL